MELANYHLLHTVTRIHANLNIDIKIHRIKSKNKTLFDENIFKVPV